jgi:hypothetical protein
MFRAEARHAALLVVEPWIRRRTMCREGFAHHDGSGTALYAQLLLERCVILTEFSPAAP